MVTAVVTPSTAQRWAAALDRAIAEALDVYVSTDGTAFVESSSQAGLLYIVTRESCSCPAGERGLACKHRACFLCQIGELSLEPASRVTLFGNSDRVEISIDGMYHGFAAYADDAGWELFQGKFPHARKRGTYCTTDELRAELEARMPLTFHIPSVQVVEVDTVAA